MDDLARRIEHTLLAPDASLVDLRRLVTEARDHDLFGVCVSSNRVAEVRALLDGLRCHAKLVTVVGFPSGAVPTTIKREETRLVVEQGADEIDVVADLGHFRDGDLARCRDDLGAVVAAAAGRPVKVILETGLLRDDHEKRELARLAVEAGAAFLKTSTGTQGRGVATAHDVALLREVAGAHVLVKASGGIRTREDALAMVAAGADRLGTSSGPRLLATDDVR